ncbi:MAG: hypothetical protein K0U93_14825 [Gammaproteobacteria bacterium]|nr:hypothetical protein [Gammaproteobacteria bacterium]
MIKLFAIWVCGLLTAVPAAIYHLLFHAERSEYAALIVFVGFWVFGFWGLVGSATAIIKTRRVYRALEHVRSPEQLKEFVHHDDTEAVAIEAMRTNAGIPQFIAKRLYALGRNKLADAEKSAPAANNNG